MIATSNFIAYKDKSSAKRGFGRKYPALIERQEEFVQQVDGKWGFYPVEESKPEEQAAAAPAPAAVRDQALEAAIEQHDEDGNDKAGAAFAAFAMNQLTANNAAADTEVQKPAARPVVITKNRPERNGVKRPSDGTACAQVWDIAFNLSELSEGAEAGTTEVVHKKVATLSEVVKAAEKLGLNKYTARTQYARWRVFNGILGRLPA